MPKPLICADCHICNSLQCKDLWIHALKLTESADDMLRGYYMAPEPIGLWKSEVPWPHRKAVNRNAEPDFLPRPDDHQNLLPMTLADLERLKLPAKLLDDAEDKKAQPEAE